MIAAKCPFVRIMFLDWRIFYLISLFDHLCFFVHVDSRCFYINEVCLCIQ